MDRTRVEKKFEELVQAGERVVSTRRATSGEIGPDEVDQHAFEEWASSATATLRAVLGDDSDHYQRALRATAQTWRFEDASLLLAIVRSALTFFRDDLGGPNDRAPNALTTIQLLCERFHAVTRQLRRRHGERTTLDVKDEYDVQDLLHALLSIFFEDIRPEENTPSVAGAGTRMDFLLKDERIVVETKMARKGLGAKEVGEELVIDIAKYRAHPDCGTLVCFVYDPDGWIKNPAAVERDLPLVAGKDFAVRVFIRPR